jgi:hypothetical protein
MPRKGKGVQRILREERRFREKKKHSKKVWRLSKHDQLPDEDNET